MDRKTELLVRVYFVFFAFILFAILILGQVVKISMVEGEKWRNQGGKLIKWKEVEGERGNIYSCHGSLLSTSVPQFDIYLDLFTVNNKLFYDNIDLLSRDLAQHFGKSEAHWKSTLIANKSKKYFRLFTKVGKAELDLLKTFPIFNQEKNKGGFIYERYNRREKPFKELCSRTIGIDRENASKVGLERTYDKLLEGEREKRLMRRLPGEIWVPVYDVDEVSHTKGADVITTLDMRLQDIAHQELVESLKEHDADAGTVIIMDVKTGAVRTMVNLGKGNNGEYYEDWNYAMGKSTEPGSTFKLISALAMIEDNVVDLDTKIDIKGGVKRFHDLIMRDSERHGVRSATFKEVFEMSSNVGMGTVAFDNYGKSREGWKKFYDRIKSMGVMNATGIEIHGEPEPYFKTPYKNEANSKTRWSGTTVPWMAHGYELMMTPLQILNYYNAVANDGRLMKPFLTKEIVKDGQVIKKVNPITINEQIASPSTILKAKKMLAGVTERGTARKLKVDNISFAGKTGTTRINYSDQEEVKKYNASFAGYFPKKNPVFSMIVVVYNPKGAYYGSKVAGIVFRDIMQRVGSKANLLKPIEIEKESAFGSHAGYSSDYKKILEYAGVGYQKESNNKWVTLDKENQALTLSKNKIKKEKVPDFVGMGLRDAVYVAESLGLELQINGVGQIYKQSKSPGSKIDGPIAVYLK